MLIDFWATWCGPCIASFPHLEKLQEKYSDDLQIIAISDEKVDIVNNFLTKKNSNLSFLNDVDRKLFKRFNISGIPISCLISKKGEFIWIGKSEDFEQILIEYLNTGETPEPYTTEFDKAYQDSNLEQGFYNFTISEGGDPKLYSAKTQKVDSVLIDIEYIFVPVTDVIRDFFQINSLSLINNRPELDTILLSFKVKSKTVTYGHGKNRILEDIQNTYNFNIQTKSKNADVYLLKIIDKNLLEKDVETIEGGGYVNRKDGQHLITRLSLNQLASYFESRLKTNFQFEGVDNSKYNFVFDEFEDMEGLKSQLNKVGIGLS
ncbi:TlpA family protein disulfide reductase, partial [Psychroflexus sp. MES1-P1E]|uniref:TlpA family protein disulfide reductase n=1 Tax=Psychroflexus sp. MES1-P1E TaxID=2058320 RepID=UPI001C608399